jgi:hypothetical protein
MLDIGKIVGIEYHGQKRKLKNKCKLDTVSE